MKQFIIKTILFSLPLLLVVIFPAAVLLVGKEDMSMQKVAELQIADPGTLFGFAYNELSFIPYKELLVQQRKPQVIALGTSRTMQFREAFFNASSTFVNAGGAGKSLGDIKLFIDGLPKDSTTSLLIIGLDQEMLFSSPYLYESRVEERGPLFFIRLFGTHVRRIYLDYLTHKYSLSELTTASQETKNIGLSALIYGNGFRYDGSYEYGEQKKEVRRLERVASQIDAQVEKLKESTEGVVGTIPVDNLEMLEEIAQMAKEKKLQLVVFLPPYPTKINNVIENKFLYTSISLILKKYDAALFDFSSIASFGGKDSEFVDAIHGTDLMYAKMSLYMANHFPVLAHYFDLGALRKMIQQASGDFLSF
jgi:hypothetical protein